MKGSKVTFPTKHKNNLWTFKHCIAFFVRPGKVKIGFEMLWIGVE